VVVGVQIPYPWPERNIMFIVVLILFILIGIVIWKYIDHYNNYNK